MLKKKLLNGIFNKTPIAISCILILSGCVNTSSKYDVPKPTLEQANAHEQVNVIKFSNDKAVNTKTQLEQVPSLTVANKAQGIQADESNFSSKKQVTAAAETMKLIDFIHHSLGDVLGANYIINDSLNSNMKQVTLNIQDNVSQRQYYKHIKEILKANEAYITFKDSVYYVFPMDKKDASSLSIGIGGRPQDMPSSAGEILQIIPLNFGINISIERTLNQLTKATITPDFDQSTIFVKGSRSQVRQVIDLVDLLDRPANRAKHIGFLTLAYISPESFVSQASLLLNNEGIPTSVGAPNQKNVVFVPLEQSGGVAIFASSQMFLNRVTSWAKKLDKPQQGTDSQFFIYHPQFARASDLGDSLAPLFGGAVSTPKGNSARDTKSAVANKVSANTAVSDGTMKMVVDERANLVIFEASGLKYQSILPLIKRLDVMPRQVLLEATIAEVTLTDEFKAGFEFNLKEGNFGFSTEGAFGLSDIVGGSLQWAGSVNTASLKAMQKNSLVNILSNPTILVRDGTTATITVGDEIPITTSSDTNDETNVVRTNIERRQTGISLTVTPTINTEGVVIMEIDQTISNVLDTEANAAASIILKREITTEVVANSGQTIILGGLISENSSNGDTKVPLLGDIPLLGHLFKSKADTKKKTELVILITPKIIVDEKQWAKIKNNFSLGLENLSF